MARARVGPTVPVLNIVAGHTSRRWARFRVDAGGSQHAGVLRFAPARRACSRLAALWKDGRAFHFLPKKNFKRNRIPINTIEPTNPIKAPSTKTPKTSPKLVGIGGQPRPGGPNVTSTMPVPIPNVPTSTAFIREIITFFRP